MASFADTPSGKVRATVWLPGQQRVQKVLPDIKAAKAWAQRTEARKTLGMRVGAGTGRSTTLARFYADTFEPLRIGATSTRKKQDAYWRNHIAPMWGPAQLNRISTIALRAWVARMTRDGSGPDTVRGAVYYLSSVMGAAVDAGAVEVNPVAGIGKLPKVPPRDWRVVDPAEIRLVVKALDDPEDPRDTFATLYLLAWQTGLRWAELAGIPVHAVDPERGILTVLQTLPRDGKLKAPKSNRRRVVPLTGEMCTRLAKLTTGRAARDLVFTHPRSGMPLDYSRTYNRVWRPAIEAAGLDAGALRPRQHDLRHSAGTHMLEGGARPDQVRDILGHADLRMTEHYTHRINDGFDTVRRIFADE